MTELTGAVVAAVTPLAIAGGTGYLLICWMAPSPPHLAIGVMRMQAQKLKLEQTLHADQSP